MIKIGNRISEISASALRCRSFHHRANNLPPESVTRCGERSWALEGDSAGAGESERLSGFYSAASFWSAMASLGGGNCGREVAAQDGEVGQGVRWIGLARGCASMLKRGRG